MKNFEETATALTAILYAMENNFINDLDSLGEKSDLTFEEWEVFNKSLNPVFSAIQTAIHNIKTADND